MILKMQAIQNEDGSLDRENIHLTDKTGRYQRTVVASAPLVALIKNGWQYVNAVEKEGKLYIRGPVHAKF